MDELKYSVGNATINRAIFFMDLKKTTVFVEDFDKEYIYEKILNEMFPDEKFFVNSCGGKKFVEEAFNEFGKNYDGGKCIYVCDGDFDLLINRHRIQDSNFIYLEKYELENYFVDRNSILELYLGRANGKIDDAIKILNYDNWYSDTIKDWMNLMILYIVVQRNDGIKMNSTSISPDKFLDKDLPIVDRMKVQEYRDELKEKLTTIGKDLKQEIAQVKSIIKSKNLKKDSLVKGKYLIASSKAYVYYLIKAKKRTPSLLNEEVFTILLNTFDRTSLNYVKNKIQNILNS